MKPSKKPIAIILGLLLFSAALGIWIHASGYAELQNRGLAYLQTSQDKYDLMYQTDSNAYTMEIDLTDLESNIGKRLWEDGEKYMEIALIDGNEQKYGGYRIFFRSHGVYDLNGGFLNTGVKHIRLSENSGTYEMSAKLITTYNGKSYEAKTQGMTGLNWHDGDFFGFYLFPSEAYDDDNVPLENAGKVTITLYNLTEHTWTKK